MSSKCEHKRAERIEVKQPDGRIMKLWRCLDCPVVIGSLMGTLAEPEKKVAGGIKKHLTT